MYEYDKQVLLKVFHNLGYVEHINVVTHHDMFHIHQFYKLKPKGDV